MTASEKPFDGTVKKQTINDCRVRYNQQLHKIRKRQQVYYQTATSADLRFESS